MARVVPAEDDVVLASLPEAHQQTGIVEIHSLDRGIMIRTNDVQPLPRPPSYDDRITTLRGRYRYEAGRRGRISVEPAEYGEVQQGAWVEMFQLISQFSPDGIGEHEASLAIKNAGLAEFSMQFPPTADHYRLVTKKDMEEPLRPLDAGGEIRVPLSELQRQAVVRVRYTTHGRGLGAWPMGRFETPVPRVDLPVLAGSWQVHLPPGIEAIAPQRIEFSDEDRHSPHSTKTDSLFESLIGPELPRRLGLLASSARRPSSDPAFRGWQVVNLPLPESGDAIITVYQGHIASTWSACLGLIAASIVLRLREPQR